MLKVDLTKDEEAFFNNKVQTVLNKVRDKCDSPLLPK